MLSNPGNIVANGTGNWDAGTVIDELGFIGSSQNGYNLYDDCLGAELWHPQHVVRLANKDGRAYFMVSQSDEGGGFITLLQTNPNQLDVATDKVIPPGDIRGSVGNYIWVDGYPSNDSNPIGAWNHPGKMEVLGGVLVVAAQNWSPPFFCGSGGEGRSVDTLLFYDVTDPEHPQYWGSIDEDELGVSEISTVSIVRTPLDQFVLNAGGDGRFSTWTAPEVSPDINNWTRIPTNTNYTFTGQHGMNFNSFQNGVEQIIYFDSDGEADRIIFSEYSSDASAIPPLAFQSQISHSVTLIGADRHWDSDSLYVSQFGEPIIYSMESDSGMNGILFQLHIK
jgi:hypothetical protein